MKARFHRLFAAVLLSFALGAVGGCSSVSTRKVVDLAPFRHIFVVHRLGDDRHLDEMFCAELRRRGHEATSGPLTMLPEKADAVLTYVDQWAGDFNVYLLQIEIEVRTARTDKKLADGRYYQPSPRTKAPEEVVRGLLDSLLAKP